MNEKLKQNLTEFGLLVVGFIIGYLYVTNTRLCI